jgi:protein-S-isoprenylcysteine O-methyltransferase Ste14
MTTQAVAAAAGQTAAAGLLRTIIIRTILANRFFSAVIRIQTDRGHHVVSSGPYRIVRHPGYVGGLTYWMPVSVALGSAWALIRSALFLIVTVIRTALEDRTLHRELPGYPEYAVRVRYRLIPGVW